MTVWYRTARVSKYRLSTFKRNLVTRSLSVADTTSKAGLRGFTIASASKGDTAERNSSRDRAERREDDNLPSKYRVTYLALQDTMKEKKGATGFLLCLYELTHSFAF